MISAEQAREAAKTASSTKVAVQLRKIELEIGARSKLGDESFHFYEVLQPEVREKLTELGYNVTGGFDRDGGYTIISWYERTT